MERCVKCHWSGFDDEVYTPSEYPPCACVKPPVSNEEEMDEGKGQSDPSSFNTD